MCRRSDAAYAEFSTSTVGIVGKLARPKHMCSAAACDQDMNNSTDELTVIGLAGAPTVGEFRHKIGRTTGWGRGTVARACVDINVSNDDATDSGITMVCQHIVSAASGAGDSGSP